jgi:hypothetical protein
MSFTFPFTQRSDVTDACQTSSVQGAAQWNALFRALPHPHMTQAYGYGEAKRLAEHWHVERIVFEQDSRPVAMCQVLEKRIAGLRVLARINRGPMFFNQAPSYAERECVMREVRKRWRIGRGGPLLILPGLEQSDENQALLSGLGFRRRKEQAWCSSRIDLRLSEDEIRKRLAPVWRNRLKAALKSGLELRVANDDLTLHWMLERHAENMRGKGFSGTRPAFLRALHKSGPDDFKILQALYQGQAVGGLVLARFGSSAEYYVGWFGEAGRKHNCGNFLYWHAMREARAAGCHWFDLGGYYSSDKFGLFKQNMRGTEYRLAGEWIGI